MTGDRRTRLDSARLYFVADCAAVPATLEAALRGGAAIFQLRDKSAPDAELLRTGAIARDLCREAGALFVVNDRPDIAAALGADGVHVGQGDAPVTAARAAIGDEGIVGLSTHSPAQLAAARGADYVAVGPVFATPTKLGRPAAGLEYVRHAVAHPPPVPWFAIGGIDAANVEDVVAAGARRIVVVRAIAHARDPESAARALCAALPQEALHGTP